MEPSTERNSTRQSRMKEKDRQKIMLLWVLLILNICALMHKMLNILISPIVFKSENFCICNNKIKMYLVNTEDQIIA